MERVLVKKILRRLCEPLERIIEKGVCNYIWTSRHKYKIFVQVGKERNSLFGAVSGCSLAYPGGVYVYGWHLPRCNYNKIEIYFQGALLGQAVLNRKREDVYRNYPFFNEHRGGWEFWAPGEFSEGEEIAVVVWQNRKVMTKHKIVITGPSVEDSLKSISQNEKLKEKPVVIFPGLSNRLGLMAKIADRMPEYQFLFLMAGLERSVETAIQNALNSGGITEEELALLEIYMLPVIFQKNELISETEIPLSDKMIQTLEEYPALDYVVENMAGKYALHGMTRSYAKYYTYHLFCYAMKITEMLSPVLVILWNRFIPLQAVFEIVCRRRGIPLCYVEGGNLPGTFAFEADGQMGESYPAWQFEEFRGLFVSEEDKIWSKRIWDYIYETKANDRYSKSATNQKKAVLAQLNLERPTLFFAGQDDYESGIFPYSEHSAKYHSPIFKSSYDAALYLAQLAQKNGWNFIYKQHPMMRPFEKECFFPCSVIRAENVEICDLIDLVDVTVVLMSQTSYMSLLRGKPVVMLGYNQMRGKGCVYEAEQKEQIEPAVFAALEYGFSQTQKDNFVLHIAQMCRYYLYDNPLIHKALPYGKPIEDCIGFFRELIAEKDRRCEEVTR